MKVNSFNKNEIIQEIEYGENIAYILKDNNTFLPTEYKVLQSHSDGYFAKCMKLTFNGKVQLFYLTNGYNSLVNIIPSLDGDSFITIITNLFADILAVKNNGFLSCQNIDIALNHVFVDSSTYKVTLVYLPIGKRLFHSISVFENELRTSLVKMIQGTPNLSSTKIQNLVVDLSNGLLSIEDIYSRTKRTAQTSENNFSDYGGKMREKNEQMKLIALNPSFQFEIEVTKDDFTVGRKQEIVDGFIPFSKMIGRSHCKIVKKGNAFAVVDLNSANGTYINTVRIQPGEPCPLKNGDTLRLANVEFKVSIG